MPPTRRRGAQLVRGRLRLLAAALAALLAAVAAAGITAIRFSGHDQASAALARSLPRPGQSGAASCTDPVGGREWRVGWAASASTSGTLVRATGFEARWVPVTVSGGWTRVTLPSASAGGRLPGTWVSAADSTWELRWVPPPARALPESASRRRGPLSALSRVLVAAADSPRFTSPDGGCSVFVAPFGSGAAAWPAVAVIGDSLTAQLDNARDRIRYGTSLVAHDLAGRHRRTELTGQSGRHWSPFTDRSAGLDAANTVLLDEIRGLRPGARAQVIALGTNDAGWIALAPDEHQRELRSAWVILHLAAQLDEVERSGTCTVVVTPEDTGVHYGGADRQWYSAAARRIGDYLKQRAADSAGDRLYVWDWAADSAPHHVAGAAVPWFGPDSIHLNAAGTAAYAAELTSAAMLCG